MWIFGDKKKEEPKAKKLGFGDLEFEFDNVDEPMRLTACYRAVNLIAGNIGKTPIHVYKRDGENRARDRKHQAAQLLRRPGVGIGQTTLKETLAYHVLLHGNAYARIQRNGLAAPKQLQILDPRHVVPLKENGHLFYVASDTDGNLYRLSEDNVIHIKGLGFDGLTGHSVIEYAADSFSLAHNAQKHTNSFFKNGAKPGVVLEHPQSLSETAAKRLKAGWDKMTSGDKMHSTVVLEDGMKANTLTFSAKDSQLIETMQWSLVDIANIFEVPAYKLGATVNTSYNSLESEQAAFLAETLDKWFVKFEEELSYKLLTTEEFKSDTHFLEFNRDSLVRTSLKDKRDYYNSALSGHPWETVNEVRKKQNLPTLGPEYDKIIAPTNNYNTGAQDDEKEMVQPGTE